MPNLSVLDGLGFDGGGKLKPNANIRTLLPQFLNLQNAPLDKVPLDQGHAALKFTQPIPLNAPNLSLSIGGRGGGNIAILTPGQHVLDPGDPFSSIAIQPDETYLQLGLAFGLTKAATVTVSSFGFGISSEQELNISSYHRYRSESGTYLAFGKALAQTAASFVLPQSVADLAALDADTVLVISGTGELQLSESFGIATPVQQIVSSTLVPGAPAVNINTSGSLTAELDVTLTGGYQIRLRRLNETTIELGAYKSKGVAVGLSLTARAGITAGAGKSDLAEKFIKALSRQPVVDVQEFQQALPGEDETARDLQIRSFTASLEKAVSGAVEARVTAGITALGSDESIWTFEVDLSKASAKDADTALSAALKGNFRGLTTPSGALPSGIRQTSNVFSHTDALKLSLNVNLLGLVNFVSVGKLARISTVERAADGTVTLVSDIADQNRLQAVIQNGITNDGRLREMLSEDFLLQASFTVSDLRVLPPQFSAKHAFFELHDKTDRNGMKDMLDVCRVVGAVTADQEQTRLQSSSDFGRSTFFIRAKYASAALAGLFLDKTGSARSVDDYELQGRKALGALLAGDQGQELRKRVADTGPAGNALWKQLKAVGAVASFAEVFGVTDRSDPRLAAAGSDYLCITFWADAMNRAAQAIADINALLKGTAKPDENTFTQARTRLRNRLADVVRNSRGHFGEPLGLMMVYFASGRAAEVRTVLTSTKMDRIDVVLPVPGDAATPLTAGATGR